jgi:formylglycine-generating enzyme required for sulfatase activity
MPERKTSPERRPLISRQVHQGQFFTEALNESIHLDMMLIPGGTFEMGQTADETSELIRLFGQEDYQKYFIYELPRHPVTVQPFFLGKYPVTQEQWRSVATYQPVDKKLELKADPSNFKGDNCPVEEVSWEAAQEFCRRLSAITGRTYRLPSEAEWEYACRAGTSTPFHFGETLSDELANYCAQDREIDGTSYKGTYGRGVLGQYRKATTEVGKFPANPFGLYDMHGNVWEWCEDDWHSNYEGAPGDGSAWLEQNRSNTYKLVRGGSWYYLPWYCRSASRNYDVGINFNVGFRVVCEPPRILLST